MADTYHSPDRHIEQAGFTFEERFCPACDDFQWHVQREDEGWECLACRLRILRSIEGEHGSKRVPRSILPEPYQTAVRRELREIPTWKLREAYGKLTAGVPTGIELVERNRAYALSAIEEVLWERGKLPTKGSSSEVALIMPIVAAVIGALSLALGVMALTRSSPLGQRVYYQDGRYLLAVRFPGQWYELRDFVQPDNPDVVALYSQIGPDVWGCHDFLCRNIDYRRDTDEHWQFPSETLRGMGDCEDTSILLTSLLNNFTNAYVVLGDYQGYGHAWCQLDGQVLESTYTEARPVPDPGNYEPLVLFNNVEVYELYPGALADIFTLRRDEAAKLNLMAGVLGGVDG